MSRSAIYEIAAGKPGQPHGKHRAKRVYVCHLKECVGRSLRAALSAASPAQGQRSNASPGIPLQSLTHPFQSRAKRAFARFTESGAVIGVQRAVAAEKHLPAPVLFGSWDIWSNFV